MSVNGITGATQSYNAKSSTKSTKETASEVRNEEAVESAAVYEKSETTSKNKIYKRDSATIDRLVEEANKRTQSLRDLVQKMLMKQGQTFDESTDIYSLLREGKVEVDPETRAQAQKDIAEDGYWGVEQTSDRLVSFAKALSGGDPSKADEMIKAVQKGFEEATKAWSGELPDISKRTLEATIKKMETWRDELTN